MDSLKILSLSRNLVKKIEKLEDVSRTLEELWLSYNQISSLDGLSSCSSLTTLYLANNRISDWGEVEKLAALPALVDLLLVGNPIIEREPDMATARAMVVKRVPQIIKLDNIVIKPEERERAKTVG